MDENVKVERIEGNVKYNLRMASIAIERLRTIIIFDNEYDMEDDNKTAFAFKCLATSALETAMHMLDLASYNTPAR